MKKKLEEILLTLSPLTTRTFPRLARLREMGAEVAARQQHLLECNGWRCADELWTSSRERIFQKAILHEKIYGETTPF